MQREPRQDIQRRRGGPSIGAAALCLSSLVLAVFLASCGDSDDPPRTDDLPVAAVAVIPAPVSVELGRGHLYLDSATSIAVERGGDAAVAELLAEVLRVPTGLSLPVVVGEAAPGDIALVVDESAGDEGYSLEIDGRNARVSASTSAGFFYGCQTLRQLLPAAIEAGTPRPDVEWKLPMLRIDDAPRFTWRGFMLDVSRHFFPPVEVRRLIDLAARYKMNRFHLHLTDDEGWRIHIDAWPNLTAIGSRMDSSGGAGGFYEKAEYADIVRYAAERFVTIVPEIDMPGHTNSALASYAELNESGEPTELRPTIPFGSSSLWIEGPMTMPFVTDVLTEIAALTPGPWIHIGGDEAFATPRALYGEFMIEVAEILRDLGKTMIGWDEIGTVAIEPPFVTQHWLSEDRAIAAAERGASIISSPARHAYLDMKYDPSTPIGFWWAGFTEVDIAYSWDPVPRGVPESAVLGVEAPLWTPTVDSRDDIDLLTFPRLLGHAEIGWSPQAARVWEEYRERLARHGPRLDASSVAYYRSPLVDWID